MRITESWRTWVVLFILLIGTAVVTAVWGSLTGRIGGEGRETTTIPVESPPIEINLPAQSLPIVGDIGGTLELTAFQAVAILTGVVVAVTIAAGVPLAIIYARLDSQATTIVESGDFKESQAALEKREKEKIEQLSAGRRVMPIPTHKMPRWSSISTSLIVLLFVIFAGMVLNGTFVPEGQFIRDNVVINSALVIVGGLVVITLPILYWRLRPQQLEAIDATDDSLEPPWDFIVVLLIGLVVIGLGIGFIVYLNPAS